MYCIFVGIWKWFFYDGRHTYLINGTRHLRCVNVCRGLFSFKSTGAHGNFYREGKCVMQTRWLCFPPGPTTVIASHGWWLDPSERCSFLRTRSFFLIFLFVFLLDFFIHARHIGWKYLDLFSFIFVVVIVGGLANKNNNGRFGAVQSV